MRIWIGNEAEGQERGARTMFVEARVITKRRARLVLRLAEQYAVKEFYFGAGKKDIILSSKAAWECFSGARTKLETSRPSRALMTRICPSFRVIVRRDFPEAYLRRAIVPKFDYQTAVRVYTDYAANSTEEVADGMYKKDKMIWPE